MKYFLIIFLLIAIKLNGQVNRKNDPNNIFWVQLFYTKPIHKKWSLHGEYQWRRDDFLKSWQQSLLRVGINYKIHPDITAHLGYGWIETFPYGDHPISVNGTFPEHRIYEQISLNHTLRNWQFAHRFRIEQRWLGSVKPGSDREIDRWIYLSRFRYQLKSQFTISKSQRTENYVGMANEVFIGAGKNLGLNIFDQNRFMLYTGYKLNKHVTIEAGLIYQLLQQGRLVNDKIIIQQNVGPYLQIQLR